MGAIRNIIQISIHWSKKNPHWIATLLLALAAFASFRYTYEATKPWETNLAERLAAGKAPTTRNFAVLGLWWASVVGGVIGSILAISARWWCRHREVVTLGWWQSSPIGNRFWYGLLAGIVLLSCYPRAARLNQSLWIDEEWTMRSYVLGEFKTEEDDSLTFHTLPWSETLWNNRYSNNHFLHAFFLRLEIRLWQWITGAEEYRFTEWITRLHSLFAGVASIALIAILLGRIGFPRAGLLAAFLLAVHPWHIRISSEARGYGLAFFFIVACFWFLLQAIDRGKWRHWIGFALCEILLLLAYSGAVYMLVVLNAVVLFSHWFLRRQQSGEMRVQGERWLVSNSLAAGSYLWIALPSLLWLPGHIKYHQQILGKWNPTWNEKLDFLSQQLLGMLWHHEAPGENTVQVTFDSLPLPYSTLLFYALVFIPIVSLLGLYSSWKKSSILALIFASPFLAGAIFLGHNKLIQNQIFPVYLLFAFPGLMILIALGIDKMGMMLGSKFWSRAVPLLYAVLFSLLVYPKVQSLLRYPLEDFVGVMERTRWRHEEPYHLGPSKVITVGIWKYWHSYDPYLLGKVHYGTRLIEVMHKAAREDKILYVTISNIKQARVLNQDIITLLENPKYFELIDVLQGHYHMTTQFIYRFTGNLPPG